jgi:hypothetical protein
LWGELNSSAERCSLLAAMVVPQRRTKAGAEGRGSELRCERRRAPSGPAVRRGSQPDRSLGYQTKKGFHLQSSARLTPKEDRGASS